RGRIDPESVPERLLDRLGAELGIDPGEVLRLIAPRAPAVQLAHARANTRRGRGAPGARTAPPKETAGWGLTTFCNALANAPDLTDEHRRAWLEAEGAEG